MVNSDNVEIKKIFIAADDVIMTSHL